MKADVGIIHGIGAKRQKKLNEKGIYKCEELNERGQDETVSLEFNLLMKFRDQVDLLRELSYLDQIPQYVVEMQV